MRSSTREHRSSAPWHTLALWRGVAMCALLATAGAVWSHAAVSHRALAQTDDDTLTLDDESGTSGASSGSGEKSNASDKSATRRSMFDTVRDGGWIGLIIFLLSLVAVGFIIEHFLTIRKGKLMPEHVLADVEQMIAQGQIHDATEFCRQPAHHSLATEVILAGLERFQGSEFGFAEYKSAVEEEGEDQTGRLYRKTEVLGVIGAIAPMLGLLGTVVGMITAFNTIADKGGMARPDELAGGISQALVTTLMGLTVAIPTMVAFSFFRNKIDSLVAEAGKRVERILMPLGRKR